VSDLATVRVRSDLERCSVCSVPIPKGRRCDKCRYLGGTAAGPSGTCARCGKRQWRSRTNLPDGQSICQPCRGWNRKEARRPHEWVRCPCGVWFPTRHPTHRSCSPTCGVKPKKPRNDPRTGRPYLRLREIVRAEEPTCWLCGAGFTGVYPDPWSFSLDHIVPITKGGSLMDRTNVRAAHYSCNLRRGNRHTQRRE